MSENVTHTKGGKTVKILRKEDKGPAYTSRNAFVPFFSSVIHKKSEESNSTEEIQAMFFHPRPPAAVHAKLSRKIDEDKNEASESAAEGMVQAKCAECEKQEGSAAKAEGSVQRLCDDCSREAKAVADSKQEQVLAKPALLIQRCEHCGKEMAPVQTGIKIGKQDDPQEKEADRMAEKVMRMPLHSFTGGGGVRPDAGKANGNSIQRSEDEAVEEVQAKPLEAVQRSADGGMHASPGFTSRLHSGDAGSAISEPVRTQMESAFQADFSAVKIHTGTEAASLSTDIGAQAFTYRNHIYFNDNKYQPDSTDGRFLLAHELTHTVQQGASPAIQRSADEEEDKEESWLDKLTNSFESALRLLVKPEVYDLIQQLRGGIVHYIKVILFELFRNLLKQHGFSDADIGSLVQLFSSLKTQMPAIVAGLASGNCKPLFAALNEMSKVVGQIAGNMWDRLMNTIEPIRLWLIKIWETYLSPAIDKITAFAGALWDKLKRFGSWLWDMFYRSLIEPHVKIWRWICKKLGFGDSDEPGFLGYISGKMAQAWEEVKEEFRPVIEPVKDVIEGMKSLVNMDAIRQMQEDAKKWLDEVAKTATAMGEDDNAVATKQLGLREVLLPALMRTIDRLRATVEAAETWLLNKINYIAGQVNGFVSRVQANALLSPVMAMINWLPQASRQLEEWVNEKVTGVFGYIISGIEKLRRFVDPVIQMLIKLVTVAGNLLKHLPDFILGPLWMLLPKCIKDPVIAWLTEVVLKKIPVIAEFIELTEKWDQIKQEALLVIKQVFVDGLLAKGLWTYFKSLLRIVGKDNLPLTDQTQKDTL